MTDAWVRMALARKRDGEPLAAETWTALIDGYVAGTIDESSIAALLMASAIRGLADQEIDALTDAMIRSGDALHFDGVVVDKHSSGGVGDTVSLAAVPLVAACGVRVAKLSGRALGHTGGTLDKLEAIPGVRTDLSPAAFRAQVERIGCAISAQSERLVPADKLLYDLRDRTGTVPSIGLIAASIVSKKVAGGATAIVFDVKTGGGAFMRTVEDARRLAGVLVGLATRLGRRAAALVTDMDEPLAPAIGNALEAIEARDFLAGTRRDSRLADVIDIVAGEMLRVGGVPDAEVAARLAAALADGSAYERFVTMIEAQGGSRATLEGMTPAAATDRVCAESAGYVGEIDAVALGEVARALGRAGGDRAGLRLRTHVGERVERGDVLAELIGADGDAAAVAKAFEIVERRPVARPLLAAVVRNAAGPASSKPALA